MSDAVEMIIEPRIRPVGSGEVRRLLPFRKRRMIGPFVFADIMGPDELPPATSMNVDAHPHIGLSTLTYLVEGRLVHRDSTGAVQTIGPRDVNWMTAGGGVTHTERSHPDDVDDVTSMFGLQTWVALPIEVEDGPAFFEHADADDIPTLDIGSSSIAVAAGTGWGAASPVSGSSPLVLADMRLHGTPVPLDAAHPERAVIALDGHVTIAGAHLPTGQLAVIEPGATPDIDGSGVALVIGGEPVGARSIWWNFVHSDPERIEDAKQRWLDQSFPAVPGDHDPFVPLPT